MPFDPWIRARRDLQRSLWLPVVQREGRLKQDDSILEWRDFGAGGPAEGRERSGRVSDLARSASSDVRKGKWLMALSGLVSRPTGEPTRLLELGTCLGSGADYLLSGAGRGAHYVGLEGSEVLAKWTAERLEIHQVNDKRSKVITGPFEQSLPRLVSEAQPFHVIFLDGFHEGRELESQWTMLEPLMAEGAVVIVDDIRWSSDMFRSWSELTRREGWLSMDLFRMGVLTRANPGYFLPPGGVRCSWRDRA